MLGVVAAPTEVIIASELAQVKTLYHKWHRTIYDPGPHPVVVANISPRQYQVVSFIVFGFCKLCVNVHFGTIKVNSSEKRRETEL